MTELVKGNSFDVAKNIISIFLNMIKNNLDIKSTELDEDQKTKIMSLSGVNQYPMRVKCATLAWHTLASAIDGKKEEVNTEVTE
jgi:nitrogen fixation NifU-like protein